MIEGSDSGLDPGHDLSEADFPEAEYAEGAVIDGGDDDFDGTSSPTNSLSSKLLSSGSAAAPSPSWRSSPGSSPESGPLFTGLTVAGVAATGLRAVSRP